MTSAERAVREQLHGVRHEFAAAMRLLSDTLDAIAEREKLLAERDRIMAQKGAEAAIAWLAARGQLLTPGQRVQAIVQGGLDRTVEITGTLD